MLSLSRLSLYWTLSTRACQLASITFPETPMVLQTSSSSYVSSRTLTTAAVPSLPSTIRTLKSTKCISLS